MTLPQNSEQPEEQRRQLFRFWSSWRGSMTAPILANNRIYIVNQAGRTSVLALGDEYKSLAQNSLASGSITATPAFVGKSIILRTDKTLYRIEE